MGEDDGVLVVGGLVEGRGVGGLVGERVVGEWVRALVGGVVLGGVWGTVGLGEEGGIGGDVGRLMGGEVVLGVGRDVVGGVVGDGVGRGDFPPEPRRSESQPRPRARALLSLFVEGMSWSDRCGSVARREVVWMELMMRATKRRRVGKFVMVDGYDTDGGGWLLLIQLSIIIRLLMCRLC